MYNQDSFDSDETAELIVDVDHRACKCPICTHDAVISLDDVARAARRLNKLNGSGLFSTDHILRGGHALHQAIAELFPTMIRTGTTPTLMFDSVVIPIPKNTRKSLNDSKDYRGIALNNPLSKPFEVSLLMCHSDVFNTSDMQFG
ncbi:hypothetical protein CAPTEDRAFT_191784 [Capitella teleta]|uniref:Uncharacterized protein n=1 Tax=Capitella teleta TaxID=283909 RepID=R7TJG3_CAPTE|nr:hypothetical protein CAPTEDRAFT_191784 [Capitella teleta]|eukprot:ELT93642.1 hypothetical protein CAPTEDRAFT_191784 [Capitella teleta]